MITRRMLRWKRPAKCGFQIFALFRACRSRPAGAASFWVLEQGRLQVTTPYTLLLDADIKLDRGIVKTLRERVDREGIPFVSLMAMPSMSGSWEKLLMPAFVHFFKILYPFGRVNSHRTRVAAAAGWMYPCGDPECWIKWVGLSLSGQPLSTIAPWPGGLSYGAPKSGCG